MFKKYVDINTNIIDKNIKSSYDTIDSKMANLTIQILNDRKSIIAKNKDIPDDIKDIDIAHVYNAYKYIDNWLYPSEGEKMTAKDTFQLLNTKDKYNAIIVDPPRAGLDKNTIKFLSESQALFL